MKKELIMTSKPVLTPAARQEISTFLLESEVHSMLESVDKLEAHIKTTIPDELLYTSGNINTGTRWGAVLFHITMLRATIRAFI